MFETEAQLIVPLLTAAGTLLFLLIRAARLRLALARVPIRIHVGGTRGKTTTCRLIAAALQASGVRTVAKTTGTEPRLILPDGSVRPWSRIGPPTVGEQRRFMLFAEGAGAKAVVLECMAIRPDLVWSSERYLVRATIAVITNLRPDHLEDTPTMDDVARGFAGLVPKQGVLVADKGALTPLLRERAAACATRIIEVDTAGLRHDEADAVIARAVCEAAGIAFAPTAAGSPAIDADPGNFGVNEIDLEGKRFHFANAFACNDAVSLSVLWERHPAPEAPVVVLLNHRQDRPLRSLQFLDWLASLPRKPPLLLLGSTAWLRRAARRRGLACEALPAPWRVSGEALLSQLARRVPDGSLVWGIGNYHGAGALMSRVLESRHACSH